jgi:hypothetical protein
MSDSSIFLISALSTSVATFAAIVFGVMALVHSNTLKGRELIDKLYSELLDDEAFYARIRAKDKILWLDNGLERLRLNKALTAFDELDYLLRPWFIQCWDSEDWEFVASEIQYFAANESVWDYVVMRIQEGLDRGFPKDIIPFTGFSELLEIMPSKYKAKPPCEIPEKHRRFFNELTLRR